MIKIILNNKKRIIMIWLVKLNFKFNRLFCQTHPKLIFFRFVRVFSDFVRVLCDFVRFLCDFSKIVAYLYTSKNSPFFKHDVIWYLKGVLVIGDFTKTTLTHWITSCFIFFPWFLRFFSVFSVFSKKMTFLRPWESLKFKKNNYLELF